MKQINKRRLRRSLRRALNESAMATGPLAKLLTKIKQHNPDRGEWQEFWLDFTDDWSAAEGIEPQSPDCYHSIMEDFLTRGDAWDREEEFAGSLWDVAQII